MSVKELNSLSIYELKIINSFIRFRLVVNDGKIIGIEMEEIKK